MESRPKNTREYIEKLHVGIEKEDIKGVKERIAGGVIPEIQEKKDNKTERNAIAAYFIEKIWAQVALQIKEDPFAFLPPELKYKSDKIFSVLMDKIGGLIRDQVHIWRIQQEDKIALPSPNQETQIFNRFKDLTYSRPGTSLDPSVFISRGVNTAVETLCLTVQVLPKVFERQFHKSMPADELMKTAHNSMPLIYALASSELAIFSEVSKKYHHRSMFGYKTFFVPEGFILAGEEGNYRLELSNFNSFAPEARKVLEVSDRTGCPAMFSTGPSKRNVIAEMSEWVFAVLEKYYVPALEREGVLEK